jgi:hypothetical protein
MIRSTLALLAVLAAAPALAEEEYTWGASTKQIEFCDWMSDIMARAWDYRTLDIKYWEMTTVPNPSDLAIYMDAWTYPTAAEDEGETERKWHRDHWTKEARSRCLRGGYGS